MSSNDPYPEGATARETDSDESDDPAADADSDAPFPESSFGWRMGWGWLPVDPPRTETERRGEDVRETDDADTWLGEGVATLLLAVGLALFLFPEPASSTLGILLMLGGLLIWLAEAL